MKKYLMAAAALCCIMNLAVLTSCSTEDNPAINPDPQPEQLAEYTVLYYAIGGRNADRFILPIISDLYNADASAFERVNVVVQYKFSTTENLLLQGFGEDFCNNFGSKTLRWKVDPTKGSGQILDDANLYGPDNSDFTCPDSLTNFINWAARNYPAKKYMLIMNDHGHGYLPHEDLPDEVQATTRGMLFDDGHDQKHFTVKNFARAVRQADIRPETIFILCCLMNNLEYQFELKDLCDYVIGSTFTMPASSASLNVLPGLLSQPNVDIEQALDAYIKADVEGWDQHYQEGGLPEDFPIYTDLTVTRTSKLDRLGLYLREFIDRLCDTYQNGTEHQQQLIDSCTIHAIKVQSERPSYDVAKYTSSIMRALPEVYDQDFYKEFGEAFTSCIVAQYYSRYLNAHNFMVDYSVTLGVQGAYAFITWNEMNGIAISPQRIDFYLPNGTVEKYNLEPYQENYYRIGEFLGYGTPWGSTLDETFGQLAFDRIVGWSRWIYLNRQHPNLFCPKEMFYQLPD